MYLLRYPDTRCTDDLRQLGESASSRAVFGGP